MPKGGEDGICCRYPPQLIASIYTLGTNENAGRYEPEVESTLNSRWPGTKKWDWCGEFTPKSEPPN
jgi:hypothetical protein